MQVNRNQYIVKTSLSKQNGQKPSENDLVNLGYMAGRYGINLVGNPNEYNSPKFTKDGPVFDINSCTSDLFEANLNKIGIKFDKLA